MCSSSTDVSSKLALGLQVSEMPERSVQQEVSPPLRGEAYWGGRRVGEGAENGQNVGRLEGRSGLGGSGTAAEDAAESYPPHQAAEPDTGPLSSV